MTTKTLYIDSRTKIKGTHADFTISLPEQMTLRGARVRVDNIRTTDTFPTVTETNRFVYFLSPTGLTVVSLQLGAYTGTTFAAELAAKTGRNCTYLPSNNSLYLGCGDATRNIWQDDELKSFPSAFFPLGVTPEHPKSIDRILRSSATVQEGFITFHFVTMAPLQDLYLTSHQLMVHESFMPNGQRYALAKMSLFGGFATTVGGETPADALYDLGEHLTLKEIDFQLRDFSGRIVPLLAPISFQLILEC